MKKRGLVPSQIGLAEKVRPQGMVAASWQAYLESLIEKEEAVRYAKEDRPLLPDTTQSARNPFFSLKALTFLLP